MGLFSKFKQKDSLEEEMAAYRKKKKSTNDLFVEKGEIEVHDVFFVIGRGAVIVGQISQGMFEEGGKIIVTRHGEDLFEAEISGIEIQRKLKKKAYAGEHIGLLLGGVEKTALLKGDVIKAK